MKKRVLAVLLALCMALTLLPGMALAADLASGSVGGVTWTLAEDGTLTFSGSGAIPESFIYHHLYPEYNGQVEKIIVNDGITEIGDFAFETLAANPVQSAQIPNSVTVLGHAVFGGKGDENVVVYCNRDSAAWKWAVDAEDCAPEELGSTEPDPVPPGTVTVKYHQNPTLTYNILNPDLIKCYPSADATATVDFTVDANKAFDSSEIIRALRFSIGISGAGANSVFPMRVTFPVPTSIDWSETVILHENGGYWENVAYVVADKNNRTVSITLNDIGDIGDFVIGEKASTDFINVLSTDNGSVIPSTRHADAGDRVSLYIHPDEGYELDELKVTDTRGRSITLRTLGDDAYTFTMPVTRVTVEATFKAVKGSANAPETTNPAEDETFNSLGTPGISGIVLNPAAMPYTDVKGPDWFYNNVEYMWKHYLMSGVSETQFAPNVTTNRGMIWTILARMNNVRTDINPGSTWYEKGMLWCKEHGITDGSNPLSDITREQLVTMLWRNSGKQGGTGDLSKFSDSADVSDYAVTAMRWAVGNGILKGENGKIDPKGTATRAQVAAMVARYGDKIVQ